MPSQIRTFSITQLTIGACANFHTQINKFITTATPAALHIETQATGYADAIATLSSIVNRQRAFVATASLSEADKVRDNASGVISSVVNAYVTSPVATKKEAALLLKPQLSPYRGIRYHEYNKQTAEVHGMLGVLDAEDNAAAITTLGLTEEVEALREANNVFEEKYLEKAAEATSRIGQADIKSEEAVDNANALYQNIVQVVNAYAIVQPTEAINTFIGQVNGLISVFTQVVGGNSTGNTGDGSDSEQPGGGTTPGGGSTGDGSDDGEL